MELNRSSICLPITYEQCEEKTEIEEFKYYNYAEKYRILVLIALSLIILEWIGKNTLFKSFI